MNPALRGKPIAVVPLLADTTCCIAVSYEGKAFGVKTGTKVGEAKKLCPGIQLIEGNHEHYIRYHNKIVPAVESCIPVEAVCSIDEIACRLTGSQQDVNVAGALAERIKGTIRTQVGSSLRCSIGVAPNRYLAKIAADMKKPDGFTVIRPRDLPGILHQLKPRDLPGVGARMEENLKRNGIVSDGEDAVAIRPRTPSRLGEHRRREDVAPPPGRRATRQGIRTAEHQPFPRSPARTSQRARCAAGPQEADDQGSDEAQARGILGKRASRSSCGFLGRTVGGRGIR